VQAINADGAAVAVSAEHIVAKGKLRQRRSDAGFVVRRCPGRQSDRKCVYLRFQALLEIGIGREKLT
jgi:hypothetical protein